MGLMTHAILEKYDFITNSMIKSTLVIIIGCVLLNINNMIPSPYLIYRFIQAIGACIIIFVCYTRDIPFLNNKLMVSLGNISFEFYLVHFVVLLYLRPYVNNIFLLSFIGIIISIVASIYLNLITKWVANSIKLR